MFNVSSDIKVHTLNLNEFDEELSADNFHKFQILLENNGVRLSKDFHIREFQLPYI